jgi:hypothetical protein
MNTEIDPHAILHEAVDLARSGRHEEALQRHLWFHQHALEHEPAMYGVRLSFALSWWVDLGEAYPPALDALKAVRDAKVDELVAGGGSRESFDDVASINGYIGEAVRTVELFRLLDSNRPELAAKCYPNAEEALVGQREYALCSRYLSDIDTRLEEMKSLRDGLISFHAGHARKDHPDLLRVPERLFADRVGRLVEILNGAGRMEEAAQVRDWALSVSDSPEVREAIARSQTAP